jgi:FHA domain-containing protein/GAF domain-containing protein
MPAKITAHPPQRPSRFLILREGESLVVGRDPESGLVLEDGRVSKRHARLAWVGEGWYLIDLDSKNGTSVNGIPAVGLGLEHGDWISFGGIMARFERVTAEEVEDLESERLARINTTVGLRRRLSADLDPYDLLLRLLQSAMEVARADRGFVIVALHGGELRVEVAAGFRQSDLDEPRFSGSRGAVERVLETKASVVASDAQADGYLGKRPSVVEQGLGVLACVPLVQDDQVLGLIYVDGPARADGFTELDLAILEALGEHATLVLAGLSGDRRVHRLLRPPGRGGADLVLLAELQQRLADLLRRPPPPPPPSA